MYLTFLVVSIYAFVNKTITIVVLNYLGTKLISTEAKLIQ